MELRCHYVYYVRSSFIAFVLGTHFCRLCGFPPFYADNNALLFEKIMRGDFAFLSPYWDKVSKVRAQMQRTFSSLTACRTRRI